MIALIPQIASTLAYLRPEARSSPPESFADVLKAATNQEPSPQSAPTSTYQVQRGDNLSGIAKKLGNIDPLELARANGLKNPNVIQPGQVLQLPSGTAGKQGSTPQTVLAKAPQTQTALAKAPQTKKDPVALAEKVAASSSKGTMVTSSWYGKSHHGRTMANGKPFDMYADTAAHKTLPMGTQLNLTNPANGSSVQVKVTDRGPFIPGRNLDVSYGAARKLGMVEAGVAKLKMNKI